MDLRSNQALEVQQIAHLRKQPAPTPTQLNYFNNTMFHINYKAEAFHNMSSSKELILLTQQSLSILFYCLNFMEMYVA